MLSLSLGLIGRLCSVILSLPGPEIIKHFSSSTQLTVKFVISESEFYGDLMYGFRKIVGKSNFSEQFRKLIIRYKRIGYSLDITRQTGCPVTNPIIIDDYASLFNCRRAVRASDPKRATS